MNATRREFIEDVFVLDEEELRKLHQALLEFGPSPRITVKCSDKLERELKELEDLLEFENSPSKEIQSLSFVGKTENYDRSVRIDFENKKGSSIYLNIEGPEDALLICSSSIQYRLASIRPWYAFLAKRDYVNVIFALLGMLWLGLMLFVGFSLLTGRWNVENTKTNDPKATILAYLIILGILFGGRFYSVSSESNPTSVVPNWRLCDWTRQETLRKERMVENVRCRWFCHFNRRGNGHIHCDACYRKVNLVCFVELSPQSDIDL